MRADIKCPYCGKLLGQHEDIVGRGDLWLFCKRCRKVRHISLDRLRITGRTAQ